MNNEVQEPETVAGHMYRMAMLSFLFTGTGEAGGGRGGNSEGSAPNPSGGVRESNICSGSVAVDREKYVVFFGINYFICW